MSLSLALAGSTGVLGINAKTVSPTIVDHNPISTRDRRGGRSAGSVGGNARGSTRRCHNWLVVGRNGDSGDVGAMIASSFGSHGVEVLAISLVEVVLKVVQSLVSFVDVFPHGDTNGEDTRTFDCIESEFDNVGVRNGVLTHLGDFLDIGDASPKIFNGVLGSQGSLRRARFCWSCLEVSFP